MKMTVRVFAVRRAPTQTWSWSIVRELDGESRIVAAAVMYYATRDAALAEVHYIGEFLAAVLRSDQLAALSGDLDDPSG